MYVSLLTNASKEMMHQNLNIYLIGTINDVFCLFYNNYISFLKWSLCVYSVHGVAVGSGAVVQLAE